MEIPCPKSAMDPDEQESSKAASARRYPILTFDTEWLGITRAFHSYLSISREQPAFPSEGQAIAMVKKEIDWVMRNVMKAEGTKRVDECQTFVPTAPGAEQEKPGKAIFQQRVSSVDFALSTLV
jgi:lariat debranching enzyme